MIKTRQYSYFQKKNAPILVRTHSTDTCTHTEKHPTINLHSSRDHRINLLRCAHKKNKTQKSKTTKTETETNKKENTNTRKKHSVKHLSRGYTLQMGFPQSFYVTQSVQYTHSSRFAQLPIKYEFKKLQFTFFSVLVQVRAPVSAFRIQYTNSYIFLSFCLLFYSVVIYRSRKMGVNNICMCFVFVTFVTHEIICRTIDSKTVPTVINAVNQSKTMLDSGLPNVTESVTSSTPTASTIESNSLEICEYFDESMGQPNFRFHEHGATVIMPLF